MNKKLNQKGSQPIITAKKHWIVYLFPAAIIISGILLFQFPEPILKIVAAVLLAIGLVMLFRKFTFKWHITPEDIFVETGYGFFSRKKIHQMPVFDIYKSSASANVVGRVFNFGTVTTTKRDHKNSLINHTNISNASEISESINTYVRSLPIHSLNQAYELKEKGVISEHEYNLVKMGYITHHFLA